MTEIEDFRTKLKSLCSKYWDRQHATGMPQELFHYCNATGLHGVVTDKCLWASDVFSLNDASEVDYSLRIASEIMSDFELLKPIAEAFRSGAFIKVYKSWQTHVCCFSSDGDSLSQWRAYGAAGYGFAIGFHFTRLHEKAWEQDFMLVPIQYSDDFSRDASDLLSALTSSTIQADAMTETAHALIILLASIKNPAFEDEDEWRLLRMKGKPDPNICFRPMHGAIVPYSKISLAADCFSRIVQGPTLHKDFGERSLKIFLDHNGLSHVDVKSSVIPLRSL